MEVASDTYLSILAESKGQYREKASKFIAIAMPVQTEEQVRAALQKIRKSYHDASHHCYAYRLGMENQNYRTNDDGEPSGSAGKPILGQILSSNLSDILIVVVRYFGGKKLGIPGLINAYRVAAREAVLNAQVIEKTVTTMVIIQFNYQLVNEVMRILKEEHCRITRQELDQPACIQFTVRRSALAKVEERLTRCGNLHQSPIGLKYPVVPQDSNHET